MTCLRDLEKKLNRFYLLLWGKWAIRLTISTTLFTLLLASFITTIIYVKQGFIPLDKSVVLALRDVFIFWFSITWNISLLLFLFRGLKYIFNTCSASYSLELLTCPKENRVEKIDIVGYGDLVKVWRKWLMLLIWLVGSEMIFALVVSKIISLNDALFSWFNIYVLYAFILLAGYFSFVILSAKCKRIRIVKC